MNMEINNKVLISGFFWRFAERCGAQGISFIVSMFLARLLEPEYYGTIALITVFISILQVFVDSGLGNALIQKKEADDLDFSTVFYFNIIVCIILYIGMYTTAPLIAKFYQDNSLIEVIRVISFTLIVSGIKNVQQAYVSRKMLFKRFFFSTIIGTIVSAFIGIIMAYSGYGIWALVFQQISNVTIDTLVLWINVKWRPKRIFSWTRLKILFSYGYKLLLSALLNTIYNEIYQIIIGKLYTTNDLAFYNRGKQFPDLIVTNINKSIDSVLFPAMSKEQEDYKKIKKMTRRAIKTSTYIMSPVIIGLAFIAPVLVKLLLTDKWLGCVVYIRIFCVVSIFYPVHTANLNAINATGHSGLFLKLEIIKKVIGICFLLITMHHGVIAMAYSLLLSGVLSQIINSWPNRKLLDYNYFEQLRDIIPNIILALFMGICTLLPKFLGLSLIFTLILQIVIGIIVYISGSIIFKFEEFFYLMSLFKKIIKI